MGSGLGRRSQQEAYHDCIDQFLQAQPVPHGRFVDCRYCLDRRKHRGESSRRSWAEFCRAAPKEIKIVATEFKFAVPARHIVAGQPVTLVLDNSQAESEHAIFFPALGVRLFAQAGKTVRKTVLFDKPGEFAFVCDLPGHREAGITGKLAVREDDMTARPEVAGLTMK
jgi:plastocyanin